MKKFYVYILCVNEMALYKRTLFQLLPCQRIPEGDRVKLTQLIQWAGPLDLFPNYVPLINH